MHGWNGPLLKIEKASGQPSVFAASQHILPIPFNASSDSLLHCFYLSNASKNYVHRRNNLAI
jgi:hypothetical protein